MPVIEQVEARFRAMAERGWLSIAWAESEGGLGKSIAFEYILWDEVGYARVARNPLASGIVAKTIARYGSEERARAATRLKRRKSRTIGSRNVRQSVERG